MDAKAMPGTSSPLAVDSELTARESVPKTSQETSKMMKTLRKLSLMFFVEAMICAPPFPPKLRWKLV
ncbi:MAG: hypothetical protein PSX80_16170 [bacterium]|nr:hypothetical protein [bacterium]